MKNRGPKTKPWGTLASTVFHDDVWPFKTTLWNLFSKKLTINLRNIFCFCLKDEEGESGHDNKDIQVSDSGNENVGDSKGETDFSKGNDDDHMTINKENSIGDCEEGNHVDYNNHAADDSQNRSYDDPSKDEGNFKTLIMKSAVSFMCELHVFICLHNFW